MDVCASEGMNQRGFVGEEVEKYNGMNQRERQTQGLSPGKVSELGWSQLAWRALGMESVSEGQQAGLPG